MPKALTHCQLLHDQECKLAESHPVKITYGEAICIAFYLILKHYTECYDRNM